MKTLFLFKGRLKKLAFFLQNSKNFLDTELKSATITQK